jgi:ketosteroid isomerase-like protein
MDVFNQAHVIYEDECKYFFFQIFFFYVRDGFIYRIGGDGM